MPNVYGNVDAITRNIFNQMVFHERVDFSVANEVTYDVVHELVDSFLSNLQVIAPYDFSNFVFQILLSPFSRFKVFKIDIYLLHQKSFNLFELGLFFFEKRRLNYFIQYLLRIGLPNNCSVDVGLIYGINFSKHRRLFFFHCLCFMYHLAFTLADLILFRDAFCYGRMYIHENSVS